VCGSSAAHAAQVVEGERAESERRDSPTAIAHLERPIAHGGENPKLAPAHYRLAQALLHQERRAEAIEHLRAARRFMTDDAAMREALAGALVRQREAEAAGTPHELASRLER
jgi:Flp pilus assembly protein TadD